MTHICVDGSILIGSDGDLSLIWLHAPITYFYTNFLPSQMDSREHIQVKDEPVTEATSFVVSESFTPNVDIYVCCFHLFSTPPWSD